ncbi:hypothetical protein Acr_22g0008100 [Actinidia rufa]|uniref:Uncharacterized protein n=1 Tax=Actinidia rufa TaxID=165716 RepID=A0A7J0GKW9_9ERIC|nr:hypothetical protein Acr_22g0008100 [Actinidia rufa]
MLHQDLGEQPTVNIARSPRYWTSDALKGRPAQTNRSKGPGRGRSKSLRRGDQTKAMTADGVMGRVHGSRRDPRKDEYGKISRRYRRHNWGDCHLEGRGGSTNLDQLMSTLIVALASSVETAAWRGSMDSFYLGQEGSEITFGILMWRGNFIG